jgi:D-alanyl-D-alanine carboxypeptidase
MFIKKYKVITKEGKAHSQLFETVKDALKEIGVSKIGKIEELSVKEEVSDTLIDRKNVAIIARRTDAEIEASDKSGHSPTFTRPALTKVFEGMTLLELGEDKVLESSLSAFGRFESNMNKDWKDNDRGYEWVLYHRKGKVLTIEQARAKYKDLDKLTTKEGALTYLNKGKA